MHKKLFAWIKPFIKPLLVVGLVLTLVLGQADGALAARSGGRIGGGSFRAPTRSMPAPSRTYSPAPSGGYYPGGGFGGGFGFPFIMPYPFIMGGGGLFSILIFLAIASFLFRSFRSAQGADSAGGYGSPSISVAKVQVGLLSEARGLQSDLDRIAAKADTSSSVGLSQVLQESTLALMRHPEYWMYAGSDTKQTSLEAAENQFNRLALAERSKFSAETLSNVNNVLKQADQPALAAAGGAIAPAEAPGEFIVVTLLVATQGKLQLPTINSSQDLRQALGQIGAVPSENLLAMELLWTPQAEGDTLSSDDVLVGYPALKLI